MLNKAFGPRLVDLAGKDQRAELEADFAPESTSSEHWGQSWAGSRPL
jgi:hypothetical protein